MKNTVNSFQVHTGCRQGGIESPVLFNIYMDFVLNCVEHDVLLKYPNTGLKYSYHTKSESSNRKQCIIHNISGNDLLRMLLYTDDIVLFCEDIDELNDILCIYMTLIFHVLASLLLLIKRRHSLIMSLKML